VKITWDCLFSLHTHTIRHTVYLILIPYAYTTTLFFCVVAIFACVGTMFLGTRDPIHFGTLSLSFLNLYSATTLEWTVSRLYV
jgi:hypothetical protein